jgi:transcriptional regulator with XRE-family HTH domain
MTDGDGTNSEWAARLGENVRNLRVARNLNQAGLAELANVSVAAVSDLERGKGSSVRTLIAIVRALGRTDWFDSLAPAVTVSPIQALRSKRAVPRTRVRVRRPRRPDGA